MSSRSPDDEDETEETPQEPTPPRSSPDAGTEQPMVKEDSTQSYRSRIVIIGERDIPFEEEKPPNFLPNFQVKVHRVSRPEKPREVGM